MRLGYEPMTVAKSYQSVPKRTPSHWASINIVGMYTLSALCVTRRRCCCQALCLSGLSVTLISLSAQTWRPTHA